MSSVLINKTYAKIAVVFFVFNAIGAYPQTETSSILSEPIEKMPDFRYGMDKKSRIVIAGIWDSERNLFKDTLNIFYPLQKKQYLKISDLNTFKIGEFERTRILPIAIPQKRYRWVRYKRHWLLFDNDGKFLRKIDNYSNTEYLHKRLIFGINLVVRNKEYQGLGSD
jgi:hypothetical protein